MDKFEHHIKKSAQSVHLSDAEKARMKNVLQSYMRFHPLPEPITTYTITRDWTLFLYRPIAASLVLVLVVGSSVSYAAEGALPGDALYSVKTNINEPVKVALASSAEEKAEVEIELAERRIQEATALVADDRLDEITEAKLAVALDTHAEAAAVIMEEIDKDDASAGAELSTRFETRLRAHEDVLAQVRTDRDKREDDETDKEDDRETSVERAIRTASSRVALLRERSEVRLALAPAIGGSLEEMDAPAVATMAMKAAPAPGAASRAMAVGTATSEAVEAPTPAVERKTAERMQKSAENKLKTVRKKARNSDAAKIELEAAEDLIEEGEDLLDGGDYAGAFFSFRASLEASERVSVFLASASVLEKARTKNTYSSESRQEEKKENGESDNYRDGRDADNERDDITRSQEESDDEKRTIEPEKPDDSQKEQKLLQNLDLSL